MRDFLNSSLRGQEILVIMSRKEVSKKMIYWTFISGVPRPDSNGQHYHCERCGAFLGNNLPEECDCGNDTELIDGGWIESQYNHPDPTLTKRV